MYSDLSLEHVARYHFLLRNYVRFFMMVKQITKRLQEALFYVSVFNCITTLNSEFTVK